MKKLIFILLFLISFSVNAQIIEDCGTWKIDSSYYIGWYNIDTINSNSDTTWIYSEWKTEYKNYTLTVYCPCGCGWNFKKYQRRVCGYSGIIQQRWQISVYKYIPKPKTEYEKLIDKLKNKNK